MYVLTYLLTYLLAYLLTERERGKMKNKLGV